MGNVERTGHQENECDTTILDNIFEFSYTYSTFISSKGVSCRSKANLNKFVIASPSS
jgi:hypothetical protein